MKDSVITSIGDLAHQVDRFESVLPDADYRILGMRSKIRGPFICET